MELPKRKHLRLSSHDYNDPGFYFITICTENKKPLFWLNETASVGAVNGRPIEPPLNSNGRIVEQAIKNISKHYPLYYVDNYAMMPDHIHLMIEIIYKEENGRPMTAPTMSTVINQLKGSVTRQLGFKVWQRSFYDHVIRDERDYAEHYQYIDDNPTMWFEGKRHQYLKLFSW